jgi:hypothetical protein
MNTRAWLAISLIIAALAMSPALVLAQQYIYTNDSIQSNRGNNTATAYSVSPSGTVTPIATYLTGGLGDNGYFFAQVGIASANTKTHECLFVADGYTNDVAGFTIDLSNGTLQAVHGSPYASGGLGGGTGLGLAVSYTSGQPLLFAGNLTSSTITSFMISSNCTLHAPQTFTVAGPPLALKATPNGKYLIVSYLSGVGSFQIASGGGLVELTPPITANGTGQGIDISCDGATAYFGTASNQVVASNISATGKLRMINGFVGAAPSDLDNVLLSADGKTLFVSNAYFPPSSVTTLAVRPGGALTYEGAITLRGGAQALGMATTPAGDLLFVAESTNSAIGVLQVSGTTLTEVPDSPFPTTGSGNDSLTVNLVAVPGNNCKLRLVN